MPVATKTQKSSELSVVSLEQGRVTFCIRGTTPLLLNSMSEKVRRELLLPSGRKTAAEKQTTMKHDPFREFRDSADVWPDDHGGPTRIRFPAAAFKAALCGAALDMPTEARKAQLGRLVRASPRWIDIYGVPQLWSTIVRSADMNRTPDVRTRALLPEWCCQVTLQFVTPNLTVNTVYTLLSASGFTQGVGDGRQEKGKLDYGCFDVVEATDPEFVRIMQHGGVAEQDAAFADPVFHDAETEKLVTWYSDEASRRGRGSTTGPKSKKPQKTGNGATA